MKLQRGQLVRYKSSPFYANELRVAELIEPSPTGQDVILNIVKIGIYYIEKSANLEIIEELFTFGHKYRHRHPYMHQPDGPITMIGYYAAGERRYPIGAFGDGTDDFVGATVLGQRHEYEDVTDAT